VPPDLSRIDFESEAVYDQICTGDTVGLFQIESRAQIQMIRRTRPRNLEDLAVEVAIVRPGPIVGGAVNPYVRRREAQRHALERGEEYDPPVAHPLLKEALAETLGVIVYQDQVLQVCQALAGFTAGQAEALRRAMSRRRSRELMENFWEEFLEGATNRGVPDVTARKVFEQVVAFSEFGFPKSHAAAFGLLAYQSAWLRHHYPVEYYTALFNNQPMGFYSLDALGRDAARHDVEIRLPDINRSDVYCRVEDCTIRVGLGFVRGFGWDVAEEVVQERARHGPFRSLGEVVRRAPPGLSRDAIENLVWVGGCDSFGLTRRELLWQVGLWLPPKTEQSDRRRVRRQLELPLVHPHECLPFGNVEARDRLLAEYQVLGFATGGHPFTLLRSTLPPNVIRSDRLGSLEHGNEVEVAGLVVARQRPETARGFTFILLEDEASMMNAIVRPEIYDRDRSVIRGEPFLWILGTLTKDDGTHNILAEEVRALKLDGVTTPCSHHTVDRSPYAFLKDLRRNVPGAKSWG
jgi:error-prone DNA polymerase